MSDSQGPLWEVFVQKKAGQPFVHCGSLHAFDKEMALQNARDLYTRRNEGMALWVVPSSAITASSPEDMG
ncbi:MAG TPA: 1,2-phenylacetyl-CoA epoxidase subunit B, partial [Bacteroidia bacterium]|nr:1,2-phenylacetyl-CoA epoxidase subunit B [Bacteroidia bacterium]